MLLHIGGRELHAATHGAGEPTVTLLHGGLVDTRSWGRFLTLLAARTRVVTFDIAGYGRSAPARDRDPFCGAANDCQEVWEHFGVRSSWVLGFSQGGLVAMELARRAPSQVDGLVLVSTAATLDEGGKRVMTRRAEEVRRHGLSPDVQVHVARAFSTRFRTEHPETIARYTAMVQESDPGTVASTLEALASVDKREALRSLPMATLVVAGDHDAQFAPLAEQTASFLADSRVRMISGAGHTVHVEEPDKLAALVLDFMHGRLEGR